MASEIILLLFHKATVLLLLRLLSLSLVLVLVSSQPNQLYKDGDIIIGAVLSVHEANATRRADFDLINACGDLIPSRVLLVSQFRRTIADINSDPNLLPGVKLGYNIIDACSLSTVATVRAMQWATTKVTATMMRPGANLQPKPVAVVVGTEYSRISAPLNMLLQQFKIPQIDFGATSADLSDRRRYRLYARTSPSDVYQARAMASLAYSLGWQCVHIVYSKGQYGEYGVVDLKMSLAKLGICTASEAQAPTSYHDHFSGEFDRIVANIEKTPSAAAIICFCEAATLRGLMMSLQKSRDVALNVGEFRPRFVIVAGDAWGTSTEIPDGLTDVAAGGITLRLATPEVSDFNDWFASQTPFQPDADPWFLEFWEEKFKCTFRTDDPQGRPRCKLDPSIRLKPSDLPSADSLGSLTTAIYAAANGLHQYLSKACSNVGDERCTPERMLSLSQRGAKLFPTISNVSFELPKVFADSGQWFQFDENGEGPARYEYHVYRRLEDAATPFGYLKIGEWSSRSPSASLFQEAKSLITWPDTNALVTSVCACRAEPLIGDSVGCRQHDPGLPGSRSNSRLRGSGKRVVPNIQPVVVGIKTPQMLDSGGDSVADQTVFIEQETFLIMESTTSSTSTTTLPTTSTSTSTTTEPTTIVTAAPLISSPSSSSEVTYSGDSSEPQPDWVPSGYLSVGLHCKGDTLPESTSVVYADLAECVTECDKEKDCYGITVSTNGEPPCYPKASGCKFVEIGDPENNKWAFIVRISYNQSGRAVKPIVVTTEEPTTTTTTTVRPHNSKANLSSSFSALFRQKVMTVLIRLPGYTDTHRHCRGGAINLEPVLDLVACQQLCDAAGDSCGGITISLKDSKTCFAKSSGCTLTSSRSDSWTFLRKEKVKVTTEAITVTAASSTTTQMTTLVPSSVPTTPHLLLPVRLSSPFASLSIKHNDDLDLIDLDDKNEQLASAEVSISTSNADVADDFSSIFKFEDAIQNRHPPSPSPSTLASLIATKGSGSSVNNGIWMLTTKAVPIPQLPSDIQRTWFGAADFADIHQHCKGGSLENALVYFSVDRCKSACRIEPTCIGISISLGGSGFCFLKNASCQLSGASDDWTFLRRQS